jgi:hypothetical protein
MTRGTSRSAASDGYGAANGTKINKAASEMSFLIIYATYGNQMPLTPAANLQSMVIPAVSREAHVNAHFSRNILSNIARWLVKRG